MDKNETLINTKSRIVFMTTVIRYYYYYYYCCVTRGNDLRLKMYIFGYVLFWIIIVNFASNGELTSCVYQFYFRRVVILIS